MKEAPRILCDARMLHNSGIGTYLRATLPRAFRSRSEWRWRLLGHPRDADWFQTHLPGAEFCASACPIYSLQEQLLGWKYGAGCAAWWSPHYNLPLLFRGPLLVTVHDVLHLAKPELFGGALKQFYARTMLRAVRRKARIVHCDSEFTAREFSRLVGDRAELRVVHLGVDEVEPAGMSSFEPLFVSLGNVKPHKNLARLIEAFALVAPSIPHRLVIVGRREGFRASDEESGKLAASLGSRVHFTGEVSDAEVQQWLARATALVHPSYYEGFGLPPLEAMAAGCPVLTSNAASLPEVCGDTAVYFDPFSIPEMAQALRMAAAWTEVERAALRDRALARAREFSWDRTAQEVTRALDECVAAKAGRA